uniref:TIL domain-containing protein n=1 Tax=Caenorhabditis tropicalis TaxID=1561998 RepID=A0A1I7UKC6_9PELO
MKILVLIFSILIVSVECGVLKNTEDQPIIHGGGTCGTTKCPDNYRCEFPMSNSECENEDGCSITPKCVLIPVSTPKCEENEEMKECGSSCEPTCDNQNPSCAPTCLTNICQCKNGFVRDSAFGKCVEKEKLQ